MKSKSVESLLVDLGVAKTHSRPHVSDDNPYSESQFKTFKYRPDFPDRFGSIEHARAHCRKFFAWYNCEHHHSGIAMLTPDVVHHGYAERVQEQRRVVLAAAYAAHPERFAHTLTEKLMIYALGRGVEAYDMPAIRKIMRDAASGGYKMQDLILGIVESYPFHYRRTPAAPQQAALTGR